MASWKQTNVNTSRRIRRRFIEHINGYYLTNTEMSYSVDVRDDLSSDWSGEPEPDPTRWYIYRVPHSIRKGKEEAYTPQIVSIGPFHCDKKELKDMDKLKRRYVRKFFERTSKKPEDVLQIINDEEIRNCYSETSNLNSDQYLKMILRDAIFIIELLVRNFERANDKLLTIPANKLALKLDLVLLGNQLPYFLLEKIYESIVGSPSFFEICLKFFGSLLFDRRIGADRRKDFKHFTDLLRRTLVQRYPKDKSRSEINEDDEDLTPLPCATKLDESGVKFTSFSSRYLLDVSFKGGKLSMPRFLVHHQTETMLRNIMALEQCLYPHKAVVCGYVKLLDSLIEDERDAQLLVDRGIISNSLGDSKALASLFNKLGAEIPLSGSNFNNISQDMRDFHQNKYNRNKAKLQRVHFGDIWKGTATIAASLFLILTFLQTITSLRQL